jgi:hypothetical protein
MDSKPFFRPLISHLHIQRNNVTILLGHRSPPYGHWLVNVPSTSPSRLPIIAPPELPFLDRPTQPTLAAANAIVPVSLLAAQVAFYHAAFFSPVMSTWCAAIDAGHLATWPHLTSAQVWRHFPQSIPMHLGHLDQVRANQQSTKPALETTLDTNTRPHSAPNPNTCIIC